MPEPPSVLSALSPAIRRLELLRAAREPLSPEEAARLFDAIAEAREALARLAEALEARAG